MANYNNINNNSAANKISIHNYDVAILAHSARGMLITGAATNSNGKFLANDPISIGNGQGQNAIATFNAITELTADLMNAKAIREGSKILIIGNNNLCAKIRTILKMAKSSTEEIAAYLTKSLPRINSDYKEALTDFIDLIIALHENCNIAAHDIYAYPIDRFNLIPAYEEAEMPEDAIGKRFTLTDGSFNDEALQGFEAGIKISGEFEIGGSNGSYYLKKDFLDSSSKLIADTFKRMLNKMPKQRETEELSAADFFAAASK